MSELLDSLKETVSRWRLALAWGANDRKTFYDLAANFIADGVPVYEAIEEVGKRWKALGNPKAQIAESLLADIRGQSGKALRFGQAMQEWAPSMEAMAIDAGEQSGDIVNGLRMASRLTEVTARIRQTMIGEMIYPAFLLLLFGAFLFMLSTAVMPVFADFLPREKWPTSPRILGALSDAAPWLYGGFLLFLMILFAAFSWSRGPWVGNARSFFDRWVPPWNIHRQVSGAIMMTCFAVLTRAGIPFSAVIAKLSVTASDWDLSHLNLMRGKMRRGMRDGDAMAGPLFDEDVRWEIGVYGRLTSFSAALESLSVRVVDRVIRKIQTFAAVLRNLIMFLIAGMIVWVYGSFFTITIAIKQAAR
ncbi:MAG: type II secretion system F family protein [Burkholderiales bacterium]|nr:type II secretion system F family protein [Burkholderiales bacterium]